MKHNRILTKVLFVLLAALLVLACGIGSLGATATPVPTNTPAATNTPLPTNTATPKPTNTPMPTATKIPPTPTPAPVGVPVTNKTYEVTVLNARELKRVYMGNYYYYPNPGYLAVELEVRVKNLRSGVTASIPWSDINVIESSGDFWFPGWGGFTAVESGKEIAASGISVNGSGDGTGLVSFDKDVYLRLIWFLTKNDPTVIFFRFDDAPLIQVVVP